MVVHFSLVSLMVFSYQQVCFLSTQKKKKGKVELRRFSQVIIWKAIFCWLGISKAGARELLCQRSFAFIHNFVNEIEINIFRKIVRNFWKCDQNVLRGFLRALLQKFGRVFQEWFLKEINQAVSLKQLSLFQCILCLIVCGSFTTTHSTCWLLNLLLCCHFPSLPNFSQCKVNVNHLWVVK